ncbi:MAG: YlxR family protein [Nocardioidaceae bacterium]
MLAARPGRCSRQRADRQSGPIRTCVGCRKRAPQQELLRVVAGDGILIPDPQRRAPGRGCSVHPDLVCLELALRRRAFGRALRVSAELDAAALRETITAEADRSYERWSSSS